MSSEYRPDIDGLRAVAILWVVLFHAFPQVFPGGFIGVDVFFVISGYLITQIILKDIDASKFSFGHFYIRRIKRIFPALILVLSFFLVFGYYLLFSDEYQSFAKHVYSSAFFVNNFVLIHEAGYFDTISELKPLLHLWSLGIEEQFYLLWPLMLWALCSKKIKAFYGIILVIGITFFINLLRAKYHATDAFYSPQTRFWELGLGGLIAYGAYPIHEFYKRYPQASFLSITGILLLVFGVFTYHQGIFYPYFYALLPILSAMCIIAFPGILNQKLLSHAKMVWIGKVSYPLYLWHWGFLSFARIIYGGKITNALALVLLMLSLGFSALTYRFIESPIRKVRHQNSERRLAFILSGLLLGLAYIGYWVFTHEGLPNRTIQTGVAKQQDDISHFDDYKKTMVACDYLSSKDGLNRCYQTKKGEPQALIWGDSHAEHLFPGLSKVFSSDNWLLLSRSSCPSLLGVKAYLNGESEFCKKTNDQILQIILSHSSIHRVVLSSVGLFYLSNEGRAAEHIGKLDPRNFHLEFPGQPNLTKEQVFRIGLQQTITALLKENKEVILVEDTPLLPFMPSGCIERPMRYQSLNCRLPKAKVLELQSRYHQLLVDVVQKYPQVKLVSGIEAICNKKDCPVVQNHHLVYRDSQHLSLYGSCLVAQKLRAQIA